MSKHTAEKWVFNDNTLLEWRNNPYSITCRKPGVHTVTIAAIRNCTSIPNTEKRANALLIAAAPDLLEALQAALSDDQPYIAKARAAIAKATGEEP